jgi:phosphonate transport system substrate-binding protein
MRHRRTFLKRLGAVGAAGLVAGCSGDGGSGDGGDSDGGDSDGGDSDGGSDGGGDSSDTATPEPEPDVTFGGDQEINFNLSPSVPQEDLNVQYAPLRDHLESYIEENHATPEGLEARMNIGSNYSAVIQALGQGTADIAETGPFAAAVGVQTDNVEVLVQRYGYGSWTYKSIVAVRNGSDIGSLADLEGRRVAFSDPLSTSGFLFPAAAMKEAGLDIGNLPEGNGSQAGFEPVFAGGHVQSYTLLEQEQVDAAGMGGFVRDTKTGPTPDAFQEVATTLHEAEGLPRAPIVASTQLPDASKEALTQAFLDAPEEVYLGADGESDTEDDLWFGDVREASVDDYQSVVSTAETLGIGPDFFA